MKRCVLVGGAPIEHYDSVKRYLDRNDFIVCCDCGLRHCEPLGVTPDLIVGDFDSRKNPSLPVETIVLPREKDDTDSFFALKTALARGFSNFLLLGITGGRLDHSIGNLSMLLYLDTLGMKALGVDDYGEMEIVSSSPVFITDTYPYFSLLNITGTAVGIDITNAKYPLENGKITCDFQYGISNEPLPGKTVRVTVKEGRLLLVRIREERQF